MNYKDTILKAVKSYCEKTGREPGGVANIIVNDGKFFDRLESGGGCTMATYEKVMSWFAEHTPTEPSKKVNNKLRT